MSKSKYYRYINRFSCFWEKKHKDIFHPKTQLSFKFFIDELIKHVYIIF